jgi:hypothetical protein
LEGCIPQEVQTQQPESRQNAQRRIPTLYDPLSIFRCLGSVFPSGEYNNLLHFVNKLLHLRSAAPKVALCSQTVCKLLHIEKTQICPSRPPPAISLSSEGANAGNSMDSTHNNRAEENHVEM